VRSYRARVSGPLLDRIDLHVEVPAVPNADLLGPFKDGGEPSVRVRERVQAARERQQQRSGVANFRLGTKQIEQVCALDTDNRRLLELAMQRLSLSARAAHRILKVARTVADLEGAERIGSTHLSEAIQYRCLDRGR
jgi:magnesium chelatase family protein